MELIRFIRFNEYALCNMLSLDIVGGGLGSGLYYQVLA